MYYLTPIPQKVEMCEQINCLRDQGIFIRENLKPTTKLEIENTPKSRYSVSRYSEFLDIVNKSQLPPYFTKYINLI